MLICMLSVRFYPDCSADSPLIASCTALGSRHDPWQFYPLPGNVKKPRGCAAGHQRPLLCLQDVGQDRRARAADILGHADLRAVHLGPIAFAPQLLGHLHDLVHSGRAYRMPAGL